jgi:hypothetical protein
VCVVKVTSFSSSNEVSIITRIIDWIFVILLLITTSFHNSLCALSLCTLSLSLSPSLSLTSSFSLSLSYSKCV